MKELISLSLWESVRVRAWRGGNETHPLLFFVASPLTPTLSQKGEGV